MFPNAGVRVKVAKVRNGDFSWHYQRCSFDGSVLDLPMHCVTVLSVYFYDKQN